MCEGTFGGQCTLKSVLKSLLNRQRYAKFKPNMNFMQNMLTISYLVTSNVRILNNFLKIKRFTILRFLNASLSTRMGVILCYSIE